MSPTGKIRISMFLLGIVICCFVVSVNAQDAGGDGGDGSDGGHQPRTGKHGDFFETSLGGPTFCRDRACPKYTQGYELRNYAESKWLTVNKEGNFVVKMQVLAGYLRGENAENKTLQIGIPVLKKMVVNNANPESMLFFTTDPNPPKPNDDRISVVTLPSTLVYVKVFDGFATQERLEEKRKELIDAIGPKYAAYPYHLGVYNSPFDKKDRHNEIWISVRKVVKNNPN